MTLPAKLRTPIFLLSITAIVGLIVWMEAWTWSHITEVRNQANAVDSERFHHSFQLEAKFRELNDAVFRFSLNPDNDIRPRIVQRQSALMLSFAGALESNRTPQEHELLLKAKTLLASYLNHVASFVDSTGPLPEMSAWRRQKEVIVAEVIATLSALADAERGALTAHLAATQAGAQALQRQFLLSSMALLFLGSALAVLVRRGVVVPLRERLRQSQRVIERQEKLSSLGVLAAGVAHEIRNPLTSIKVRLFTQQQLLRKGSEEYDDNVFLADEISRLEKIVKDFLAFARPSDPEFVVTQATVPMRELQPLLQPSLRKANIEWKEEFLADPRIKTDTAQLKQVLINLVKNAAEAMPEGGSVTLRTRLERRGRGTGAPNVAVLEVADSGPGIPPEVAKRLFDPFFTTKSNGTGLGLSIAARIIESHGGTLEYSTHKDQGATFRIVMPIEAP